MRTYEFDKQGDWTLGLIEGADELKQAVEHNLYVRLGEWFLNETVGLSREYFEEKPPSKKRITAELTRAILYDERVKEIVSLDLDYNPRERTLYVDFVINTEEGVVDGEIDRRFWI